LTCIETQEAVILSLHTAYCCILKDTIKRIQPFVFANFPGNLKRKSSSLTYKNKAYKEARHSFEKSENESPWSRRIWKKLLATGDDFHYQCAFSGGGALISQDRGFGEWEARNEFACLGKLILDGCTGCWLWLVVSRKLLPSSFVLQIPCGACR
jgi:hypothetical protein